MKSVVMGIAALVLVFAALVYFGVRLNTMGMPRTTNADGTSLQEIHGCGRDELAWSEPTKILNTDVNDKVLKVTVLANATCGDVFAVEPKTSRLANAIELSWDWWSPPNAIVAACKCTRRLEFSIPSSEGMPNKITIAPKNAKTN
jgi:hypothetical protein